MHLQGSGKCIGFVKSGIQTMDAPPDGPSHYIPNICFGFVITNSAEHNSQIKENNNLGNKYLPSAVISSDGIEISLTSGEIKKLSNISYEQALESGNDRSFKRYRFVDYLEEINMYLIVVSGYEWEDSFLVSGKTGKEIPVQAQSTSSYDIIRKDKTVYFGGYRNDPGQFSGFHGIVVTKIDLETENYELIYRISEDISEWQITSLWSVNDEFRTILLRYSKPGQAREERSALFQLEGENVKGFYFDIPSQKYLPI